MSQLAVVDDDVEAVSRIVAMEGSYHGHDGIRRWWEDLLDAFPDLMLPPVEVRIVEGPRSRSSASAGTAQPAGPSGALLDSQPVE